MFLSGGAHSRWLDRLRRKGETGATSVLVVVLLTVGPTSVLFAAAALSVDVGNLMAERRQQQNGADAAAMTVARICADTPALCVPGLSTDAKVVGVANANAPDGANYVASICGSALARVSAPSLAPCGTTPTALTDCPSVTSAAAAIPYVEVRTLSAKPGTNGSSPVVNRLSRIATRSTSQTTVAACARAGWTGGFPSTLNVLPVTMSYCDWQAQTGYNGTPGSAVYPPGPMDSLAPTGYGVGNPWSASWQRTVYTKGSPTTCPTWNGHTAPGGFAQLDTNTVCSVSTSNNAWYHGQPGNSTPCPTATFNGLVGTIVYLPVFDCMTPAPVTIDPSTDCNSGSGNNTYYHVSGYAAFYLTGWYFSSGTQPSIVNGVTPCSNGDRCMMGWFTKDLLTAAELNALIANTPGAPNYGLTKVGQLG
jgi:hypothetical protein